MTFFNLTATQQVDELLISCNETPEPFADSYMNGSLIYKELHDKWLVSRKTYPLKKECENDIIPLIMDEFYETFGALYFDNALKKGINIDFLKDRLELVSNCCGRCIDYEDCDTREPKKEFILKPEPIVEDKTQEDVLITSLRKQIIELQDVAKRWERLYYSEVKMSHEIIKENLDLKKIKMETITITIPKDAAYELFLLVTESGDTGNEEWDAKIKIVEKKLKEKL